jgi:hypothetical protein
MSETAFDNAEHAPPGAAGSRWPPRLCPPLAIILALFVTYTVSPGLYARCPAHPLRESPMVEIAAAGSFALYGLYRLRAVRGRS